MLMLAAGSFLFGLLLAMFRFNKTNPQKVPFWVEAKILQAAGSLMLYFRTTTFDGLTVLANTALLSGCACRDYSSVPGNNISRYTLPVRISFPSPEHLFLLARPIPL